MVNAQMRTYDYYTFGEDDGYGQPGLSDTPTGTVKMAINISTQSVQDNINYADAEYVGLTLAAVDDSFVIDFGGQKLKVLYVNPMGRFKQVFLKKM